MSPSHARRFEGVTLPEKPMKLLRRPGLQETIIIPLSVVANSLAGRGFV